MIGAGGLAGLAGWRLLQRTAPQQMATLARTPQLQREQAAFAARLADRPTAEALVGDYRSLKVALTAFGLEADLPNRAFLRKVLESDLNQDSSLAGRLADKRYAGFARAFGFAEASPPARDEIVRTIGARYLEREFERRIGETDGNLRLALHAHRELASLARRGSSDATKWYEILGSPPLAQVVRGALGVPASLARAPIDTQVSTLREGLERAVGATSPAALADPTTLGRLIDRFVIAATVGNATPTPYSTALALLRGS